MADPTSPVRLRQIALVSDNLARARDHLTRILDVPVIYEDPAVEQWGLKNFLVPLGGDIIEVVAPFKPGTTAGRLLDKRGEGGYMLIMQTHDAEARRKLIESRSQAKVIFSHPFSHSYPSWNGGDSDEGLCCQYHPKSVPGGLMPELDSHRPCRQNPTPLVTRFSPWHPCGSDYDSYVLKMKRTAHLHLLSCCVNLSASDNNQAKGATDRWSDVFGIPKARDDTLAFCNASVNFRQSPTAEKQDPEGLSFIVIGVDGRENIDAIAYRARAAGRPCMDLEGRMIQVEMVGIRWLFVEMQDWPGRDRSISKL